jgi:hypothetical protein
MGDVVNLRTERKRAERRQKADKAAEQRLRHGKSKNERALASARTSRAERDLDLHRLETGDGE